PIWQRYWDDFVVKSAWAEGVDWEPQAGYIAPPLDGIWATAPFFHNGSVPTLELVLDSSRRPVYWRRTSLDSSDYDWTAVGWNYAELPSGKTDQPDAVHVYDTTRPGYGNGGHVFGDALSEDDRAAVIEYLKTL